MKDNLREIFKNLIIGWGFGGAFLFFLLAHFENDSIWQDFIYLVMFLLVISLTIFVCQKWFRKRPPTLWNAPFIPVILLVCVIISLPESGVNKTILDYLAIDRGEAELVMLYDLALILALAFFGFSLYRFAKRWLISMREWDVNAKDFIRSRKTSSTDIISQILVVLVPAILLILYAILFV